MVKQTKSMDGFVPRRPNRKVGAAIGGEEPIQHQKPEKKKEKEKVKTGLLSPERSLLNRAEIDESLRGIDDEETREPKSRRRGIARKFLQKKWVKRGALALLIVLLAVGAYLGIRAIIAGSNVFQGNIFDIFQTVPLKQDANGRSNILVVGTSEDDPGHQGATLTDSMMILSIDQTNKNAYMISIPRDLYVQYGRACNSGYAGKINEYYGCVKEGESVEQARAALKKEAAFVGDIFGLDIQYGVNVNYTVMRELVKAVGGSITIKIESRHPDGVLDSNFDWKCGVGDYRVSQAERIRRCPPRGHFIDFPNGPVTLNPEQTLYLAQARGDRAPTYGFEQSNFDREKNQQKIIKALREKALSAGVLADFNKVSALIQALGNNLRSTFEFKEFRTLVSIAQEIQSEDIKSISLIDEDNPIMTTGDVGGMSIVQPTAGLHDYSELRALLRQKLSSNPIVREAAPIVVLNGSDIAGAAQTEADKLEEVKYTIASVGNAPGTDYPRYTLYQIGKDNDATAKKLEKRYNVKAKKTKPPVVVDSTIRFVLIVGPQPGAAEG